jgi:5-oxoprolinase (ATP-hydrolysing) subunit A
MNFDLNCDLGEGERRRRTEALMRVITSANVACGGHAGTVETMERCIRLAKKYKVRLGAHPGPTDRSGFGRAEVKITASELELLLFQQVGTLERIAAAHSVKLRHIKLHGGLYHATERDEQLAKAYLNIVRRWWPRVVVYALAGGTVARLAKSIRVWEEAFLDRNYLDDGALVPRSESKALLKTRNEVRNRIEQLAIGRVTTVSGKAIKLKPRTLCIHADTPRAVEFARGASQVLARGRRTGRTRR